MSRLLRVRPNSYGLAIAMVAAATLATQWLLSVLDVETYTLFDAVAAVIAWYGGITAGLLAVALSVLAISVFLLNPQHILIISSGSTWHLVLFTLVALLIVFLTAELQSARQRIEQLSDRKVQQQEAQLHMALQAAQMGIWYWDLSSGNIIWSPEHETIFGLAPNMFDGRYATFEACIYEPDLDNLTQVVQQAIRYRIEYHHEYRVVWSTAASTGSKGGGRLSMMTVGNQLK